MRVWWLIAEPFFDNKATRTFWCTPDHHIRTQFWLLTEGGDFVRVA